MGTESIDTGSIDFSIDNVDIQTAGIVIEDGGMEGGVARNEEAMSILSNSETRGQFIDEIVEVQTNQEILQCFLSCGYNSFVNFSWKDFCPNE